jgi:hypothetical protein
MVLSALLVLGQPANALELRVTIGDLAPAMQAMPGGTVFDPSELTPAVVRLTGAPAGARGQIVVGEDGLPMLVLEVPLVSPAAGIMARIASTRMANGITLAAPLYVVPPIPSGDGAPPAKAASPVVLEVPAPVLLQASVASARGASTAHLSVRIGSARAS